MKRINNILMFFLFISILGVLGFFIPNIVGEMEDIYRNIILPSSLSYIMSYILFYMTVLVPQKEQERKDSETLNILYDVLQRRLTDCFHEIDIYFGISWLGDIDLFEGIYSPDVNIKKVDAIRYFIGLMERKDLFDVFLQRFGKSIKHYSFNDEAVKLYEDTDFKALLNEIENVILPQLLPYEKDQIRKKYLLDLYRNISDSSRKVNSQKESCAGVLYGHLVSFVKCGEKTISTIC